MARKKQFQIVSHGNWYDVPVSYVQPVQAVVAPEVVYLPYKPLGRRIAGAVGFYVLGFLGNVVRSIPQVLAFVWADMTSQHTA